MDERLFARFARQRAPSASIPNEASTIESADGPQRGKLRWKQPNVSTLLCMLHHPIYYSAYVYGRRKTDPRKAIKGNVNSGRVWASSGPWDVYIEDKLPAYISKQRLEVNQKKLWENAAKYRLGTAMRGTSMLAGRVVCGNCGRHMSVSYSGRSKDRFAIENGTRHEIITSLIPEFDAHSAAHRKQHPRVSKPIRRGNAARIHGQVAPQNVHRIDARRAAPQEMASSDSVVPPCAIAPEQIRLGKGLLTQTNGYDHLARAQDVAIRNRQPEGSRGIDCCVWLGSVGWARRYARKASLTAASLANACATSSANRTTRSRSRYRAAYLPRTTTPRIRRLAFVRGSSHLHSLCAQVGSPWGHC
jgi:hypothetical protein